MNTVKIIKLTHNRYLIHSIASNASSDDPKETQFKGSPRDAFVGSSLKFEKLLNSSFSEPVNVVGTQIRYTSTDLYKKLSPIQISKQTNKSIDRCEEKGELNESEGLSFKSFSKCLSPRGPEFEVPTKGDRSIYLSPSTSTHLKENQYGGFEKETILDMLPSKTVAHPNEKTKERISKLGQKLKGFPSSKTIQRSRRTSSDKYNKDVASCLSPDSMNDEELAGLICIDIENNPLKKLLLEQKDPEVKKMLITRSATPNLRKSTRNREIEKEPILKHDVVAETSSLSLADKIKNIIHHNEHLSESSLVTKSKRNQNLLNRKEFVALEGDKNTILNIDYNDIQTGIHDDTHNVLVPGKRANFMPTDITHIEGANTSQRHVTPLSDRSLLLPLKDLNTAENIFNQRPEGPNSVLEFLNLNTLKTPTIPKRIWENKENIREDLSLAPSKKDTNEILSERRNALLSVETNKATIQSTLQAKSQAGEKEKVIKALPNKFEELVDISPIKKKSADPSKSDFSANPSKSDLKAEPSIAVSEKFLPNIATKLQNSEDYGNLKVNRIEALRDKLQNIRSASQLVEKKSSHASSMVRDEEDLQDLQEEFKEKSQGKIAPLLSQETQHQVAEKEIQYQSTEKGILKVTSNTSLYLKGSEVGSNTINKSNASIKVADSYQERNPDTKCDKMLSNENSLQANISQRSTKQNRFDSLREKINIINSRSNCFGEEVTWNRESAKRHKENTLRGRPTKIGDSLSEKNKSLSIETSHSIRTKEGRADAFPKDSTRFLEKDTIVSKLEPIKKNLNRGRDSPA